MENYKLECDQYQVGKEFMRANEFINEIFQPGKKNWEWIRRDHRVAIARFSAGDRTYAWEAYPNEYSPTKWTIQFKIVRELTDPDRSDVWGKTGTGNSAEVMSTAVDITRAFIKEYGDKISEFTFDAKEDSRIRLYAKMIARLLPGWELNQQYNTNFGMEFRLTNPKANEPVNESYQPPELSTGDTVLMGKFKNRKAEIKSFTKDKHNQPVLKTNKGEVQLFKPRIVKLMSKDVVEAEADTPIAREISNQLRAAGYHHVGSGADANVFAKDDSHVIKILMPEDAGSKAEQVFRKFYEFSIAHQDLACVPRFNEVNTIDINGKDYTQIEMEKLSPIQTDSFVEGLIWLLSDYTSSPEPWETIERELAEPKTWEIYSSKYANTFARTWQSLLENPASKKTYAMYIQLYNVMKLLYSTGNINKFGWDLHTANVMLRQNGQPVIIDPWFSEGTS